MACTIDRPSPQALFDQIKNQFSATVLGGSPVIAESNEWYAVSLQYAAAEEFWAIADQLNKETDPRTACCDNLYTIASNNGVFPRAAGFAQGYVMLTGTPGAALSSSMEMTFQGKNYRTMGNVPAQLDENGEALVQFQALESGEASNTGTSTTTGTLLDPPTGVNQTVTVFGGRFCGGNEEETCEQFRQRYLQRMAYKPRATQAWVKEKLLEWPCATRVCERAGSCCVNDGLDDCACVDCQDNNKLEFYVMFDGTFPCGIPPQCVVDDINAWMWGTPQGRGLGQVEIGVCGRIIAPTAALFDMSIDIDDCLSPSQQNDVRAAIMDYMGTRCPSEDITQQAISAVISQVIGVDTTFEALFVPHEGTEDCLSLSRCDDLEVACDCHPCLSEITFEGPGFSPSECL